jgi:LmbE family N-acetylglucosaminyl deacetylase
MKLFTAILAAAALVLAPAVTAAPAQAATQRVTVIYAPHPDDETLRLSGYISYAASRGDKLILVAASDGGGTGLVHAWGWSPQGMEEHRRIEQENAWGALTNGKGTIIRLGLPDGNIPAYKAAITKQAQALEAQYGSANVEHYVAARDDDVHPDHRAVVQAVRDAHVRIVRVSHEPGYHGGTKYLPPNTGAAVYAYNSYRTIGWVSVPGLFNNLRNQGYASYITF